VEGTHIPLLVRRGGREAAGVVAYAEILPVATTPYLDSSVKWRHTSASPPSVRFPIPFPIPHDKRDDGGELMKVRLHPYLRPLLERKAPGHDEIRARGANRLHDLRWSRGGSACPHAGLTGSSSIRTEIAQPAGMMGMSSFRQ
jgi:hypothetical protein